MEAVSNYAGRHVAETTARLSKQIRTRVLNQKPSERTHPRMISRGRSYGPPLYEAVSVATTVIYWPENGNEERKYTPDPTPSAGLDELPKHLPAGGSIVSVHQPTESLAWLEENYDTHHLVKSIRKKFGGPVAAMVSPDEPGLTIFGPHTESTMAQLAQQLANESQFPVMSRPAAANPALKFNESRRLGKDTASYGEEKIERMVQTLTAEPVVVMNARTHHHHGGHHRQSPSVDARPLTVSTEAGHFSPTIGGLTSTGHISSRRSSVATVRPGSPIPTPHSSGSSESGDSSSTAAASPHDRFVQPLGSGSGGNDPDGEDDPNSEADKWEEWVSPLHLKKTNIEIQKNDSNHTPVHLQIYSKTQFKTYPDGMAPPNPNKAWGETRSQAQVHTKLCLRFPRNEVTVDRSWTTLGLEAHREGSILDQENLSCDLLDTTPSKQTIAENDQSGFNASVGIGLAGVIPTPTATVGYQSGHSTTRTREAFDNDTAQKQYDMTSELGECWLIKDGKSYASYNYSYSVPKSSPPPVEVGFAFGINFLDVNSKNEWMQPPRVSYINRNQIFIWVEDPELRSGMRGLILLLSNQVPDIRRRSPILSTTFLKVPLASGQTCEHPTNRGNDACASYLGVVPVAQPQDKIAPEAPRTRNRRQKFKAATKKALKRMQTAVPQVSLTPCEFVSQGWDVTNKEWRKAVYPGLDKHFRPVTTQDRSLVAYTISPF
ncbi:hypothetical protein C8R46DRAFT_1056260 [Mycena filopes]|nr:hypothetical protein C8R46DRAFT_1056260 [Mycena filopes]